VPVAVSVPQDTEIAVSMTTKTWAFGEVTGKPVGSAQ